MHRIGLHAALLGVGLFAGACSSERSQGFSEGISGAAAKTVRGGTTARGPHGEKLVLYKPGHVKIDRGRSETMRVRVKRENIEDPVRVSMTQLPQGVEAVDMPREIHSDTIEVVLRADPNAALVKNHEALVTVDGPKDMRATEAFKISVRERD